MNERLTRRRYLYSTGTASLVGLAGCSETLSSDDTSDRDTTTHETSDLRGATFTFDYSAEDDEVTVTFDGGAPILAGDLELRSASEKRVVWAALGSTVAAPDERLSAGATAVLGDSTINWGQPVTPDATIRLVHVGKATPATLGRFSPPNPTTLTTTVPQTTTAQTTAPRTTSATTTATTTTTATESQDTTAPNVAAFSIANPGEQRLRVSFDTDERLATIAVSLEGAVSRRLTTREFSSSSNQNGGYTHEASIDAETTGEVTASLLEAADQAGNDGAADETVSLTIRATIPDALETVFHHPLDGSYVDSAHDITGEPASNDIGFIDTDRGEVLSLSGRSSGSDAGYYDIPYADLSNHVDDGTAITTAFWTRPVSLDQWYVFFVGTGITVNTRHGELRINRWNRKTRENEYKTTVAAESVLTAGAWHHVAATVDPGNEARLFVDGERVASTSVDADQGFKQKQGGGIDAARVGWVASGDDGGLDAHYQGDLDDFRFFAGSIDDDSATQLYEAMSD